MGLRNKLRKDLQDTQGVDTSLACLIKYDWDIWNIGKITSKNTSFYKNLIFDTYFSLIYIIYF
jgi:hypothetical protein